MAGRLDGKVALVTGGGSGRVHSRDVTPESVLLQAASSQW